MAIQFNSTLLGAGVCAGYFSGFASSGGGGLMSMVFYPNTIAMPTVAPTNAMTQTGRIATVTNQTFARSGSTFYLVNGFAFTPEITATIGWVHLFTNYQSSVAMVTDSISVTDPKAAFQLTTLNAVTGTSITVSTISFSFLGGSV